MTWFLFVSDGRRRVGGNGRQRCGADRFVTFLADSIPAQSATSSAQTHRNTHTRTHTRTHTPIHTYIYIYICIHVHIHIERERL